MILTLKSVFLFSNAVQNYPMVLHFSSTALSFLCIIYVLIELFFFALIITRRDDKASAETMMMTGACVFSDERKKLSKALVLLNFCTKIKSMPCFYLGMNKKIKTLQWYLLMKKSERILATNLIYKHKSIVLLSVFNQQQKKKSRHAKISFIFDFACQLWVTVTNSPRMVWVFNCFWDMGKLCIISDFSSNM